MLRIGKFIINILPIIAAVIIGAGIIYAATSGSAAGGGAVTQFTTNTGDCRNITNNNSLPLFIPANTTGEWNAFLNNAPGKTVSGCYTYSWQTGGWGSCSASCGGGTQSRSVWCQRSDGATVADGFCSGGKPATSQSCNTQSCGQCIIQVSAGVNGGGGPPGGPYSVNYGYSISINNTTGSSACGASLSKDRSTSFGDPGPYSVPAGGTGGGGPSGWDGNASTPFSVSGTATGITCPAGTSPSAPSGYTASCSANQIDATTIGSCSSSRTITCQ